MFNTDQTLPVVLCVDHILNMYFGNILQNTYMYAFKSFSTLIYLGRTARKKVISLPIKLGFVPLTSMC